MTGTQRIEARIERGFQNLPTPAEAMRYLKTRKIGQDGICLVFRAVQSGTFSRTVESVLALEGEIWEEKVVHEPYVGDAYYLTCYLPVEATFNLLNI